MTDAFVCRRVVVRGCVQGVGFRDWVARKGRVLGLEGWVRNRRDGSVEVVFGGRPEAADAMVAAARSGPEAASVTRCDDHAAEPAMLDLRPAGELFSILPTM